ncbi:MAG TPA: VOC family protein [Cyclobacteriaceae bacterium]|nr:VOC family protein [Cyclobacteriaceae bacterium]
MHTKFSHVAILVKSVEESGDFYRDILGLREVEEPFKDGLHRWFELGSGTLHLIEEPWKELVFRRSNHLCLSVDDLDAFIIKLQSNDISFEDARGNKNKIHIRPDGIRQIFFRDPSGYWVEVNNDYQ